MGLEGLGWMGEISIVLCFTAPIFNYRIVFIWVKKKVWMHLKRISGSLDGVTGGMIGTEKLKVPTHLRRKEWRVWSRHCQRDGAHERQTSQGRWFCPVLPDLMCEKESKELPSSWKRREPQQHVGDAGVLQGSVISGEPGTGNIAKRGAAQRPHATAPHSKSIYLESWHTISKCRACSCKDMMSRKSQWTRGQEAWILTLALSLIVNGILVIQSTSLDLFLLCQMRDKVMSQLVPGLTASASMEELLYFSQDRHHYLKTKKSLGKGLFSEKFWSWKATVPCKTNKMQCFIHTRQDKSNSLPLRRL